MLKVFSFCSSPLATDQINCRGRDANQHLYGVIEGLLKEGIKRHQSFDAYAHCVSYSAEAASAIRRQFLREWGDVLFEVLQTGLEIDATVLDKYVTAVGILSYMYNPVADPRQNPVGRAALNAMPNFNLRAHARHFGLPAMDRSLVEALLTESVLLDVDSTIIERVANFTSGVRSGRGGSGSTYNAITMGVMRRCLAPRVGNYPLPSTKESIKRLLGPLIRNFLPYRVLQNVPLGKVRL